jgi:phage gpG-like protein
LARPRGGFGDISLGIYGVPGGYVELLGDWYPVQNDPEHTADRMLRLADYYGNTNIVLAEIASLGRASIEERFETQTDPDGTPWVPLSDIYLEWKVQHGGTADQILVLTGELRDAATSPENWVIEGDTLLFRPSRLPVYAGFHQTGTGDERVLRRGEVGSPSRTATTGRVGQGRGLPARPFIGFDESSIVAFGEVFERWADAGIDYFTGTYTNPRTGVTQLRDVRGRFGPRV